MTAGEQAEQQCKRGNAQPGTGEEHDAKDDRQHPPMTSIAREPGVSSLAKAAMISRNPPANAQSGDETVPGGGTSMKACTDRSHNIGPVRDKWNLRSVPNGQWYMLLRIIILRPR